MKFKSLLIGLALLGVAVGAGADTVKLNVAEMDSDAVQALQNGQASITATANSDYKIANVNRNGDNVVISVDVPTDEVTAFKNTVNNAGAAVSFPPEADIEKVPLSGRGEAPDGSISASAMQISAGCFYCTGQDGKKVYMSSLPAPAGVCKIHSRTHRC